MKQHRWFLKKPIHSVLDIYVQKTAFFTSGALFSSKNLRQRLFLPKQSTSPITPA